MAEDLKQDRTKAKRAVTKQINKMKQSLAEDDTDNLESDVTKLKQLFKTFSDCHDQYHETLTKDDEIDSSDSYFYQEQDSYIQLLEKIKSLAIPKTVLQNSDPDISKEELIGMINMPKVELEVFTGNPVTFHQFMKSFDLNVDKMCTDSDVKLSRLMQYTSGPARDAIRCCQLVGGDDGYQQARDILCNRFGNAHLVTERIIKDLRSGKPVKNSQDVQQLADDVKSAEMILSQLKMINEVNSQSMILDIIGRLQAYLQIRWKKHALESKKSIGSYPNFHSLVTFMADVATEINDPVYGNLNPRKQEKLRDKPKSASASFTTGMFPQGSTGATALNSRQSSYARPEPPCVLCGQPHRLWHCEVFRKMTPKERLDIVVKFKLCHNCLLVSHETSMCGKRSVCSVAGCGKKHTMYIHIPDTEKSNNNQVKVMNASFITDNGTHMPIVEVTVNNSQKVFALLDNASSNSFCSKQLAKHLGIRGRSEQYELSTLSNSVTKRSELVSLSLSSNNGETLDLPNVYIVDSIPAKCGQIDVSTYMHLKGIDLPAVEASERQNGDVLVDVLIGQDNAEALVPLEVRKGKKGEPFAVRTIFGWCVNGQTTIGRVSQSVISHFISTLNATDEMRDIWDIQDDNMDQKSLSQEDKSVINLWNEECKKVDDHYELPIPWKDGDEPLPNNYVVARTRLESLMKKLKNEGLMERYDAEISKLLDKGYAEMVNEDEVHNADRIWYLPHQAVINDKKPDKLRVVYDCASRYQGKSLNERCKQGPDLINKLLHVLLRFRLHQYAVQADIEAMYNQVKIPVKDRDALRFLWYIGDKVVIYCMTSHLFGGVWCASSSTYALRRTVIDCIDVDPRVKDTIENSFCVDDCLKSIETKQEVRNIISETPKVLSNGGFNLTKFVVNNEEILDEISQDHRAKEVKEFGPESEGRVLGIKWNISLDKFFFDVSNKLTDEGDVTRRKMLSIISSIFDPLGLLGPVVLVGKLLFQEVTRLKLSWDENVPYDLAVKWRAWIRSLSSIEHLRIPRCIKPSEFDDAYVELHHFSDASHLAYGCCTYLRCINKEGKIHTELIMSKNRVAPLKQCTGPRLELQGAVLAAKVNSLLKKQLDINIDHHYFWVDSEIVLKYICNDTKRFHVFVGNRVSTIRQLSDPDQWNFISGKENPADVLSRGQTIEHLDQEMWFKGPPFLSKHKCDWSANSTKHLDLSENDPEVKQKPFKVCGLAVDVNAETEKQKVMENPLNQIMNHYSSWYKMKRTLAWWMRFSDILRKRVTEKRCLSVNDIKRAEVILLKHVQSQSFEKETQMLYQNRAINKSSSLIRLNPYIDVEGLLRVGGRLRHADVDNKHPCIIPKDHVIATAIARDYHVKAHLGVEWVLSNIRQEFWVIKARPLVKRLVKSCVICRKLYAKPCQQRMADLPRERVESNKPPFTYVGIDVFGPFYVKVNRSEVKRYGCMFTCLVIRVVHIEKLDSLDTESFLNGFRRFASRRGYPLKIFSDNGTNFVGGEAELKKALHELSEKEIQAYAVRNNVDWHFNPPSASHMGGAWERMIGSTRRIMKALLSQNVRLTDEILMTIFCEIESIINGRPLTKLSDDPGDSAPLTPNHLLLLREGPMMPPGKFGPDDIYRRRWRHVQHIANQFWQKWMKLYLPELQVRSKWSGVSRNLSVGDLVLILDENTPRNIWPLARVVEVSVGRDGLVRSARLKTRSTELVRPISKIVLLEAHNGT